MTSTLLVFFDVKNARSSVLKRGLITVAEPSQIRPNKPLLARIAEQFSFEYRQKYEEK